MVKINRIYTRTGDDGTTGLVGGVRIAKEALRVEAYGEIDELNSILGMIRTKSLQHPNHPPLVVLAERLARVQNELFDIGAILATPPGASSSVPFTAAATARLERWIDEVSTVLPELRSFVIPGGGELNSWCHIARTVCRRAERAILRLHRDEPVAVELLQYINRLSDLLFALARFASAQLGEGEFLWAPGAAAAAEATDSK